MQGQWAGSGRVDSGLCCESSHGVIEGLAVEDDGA